MKGTAVFGLSWLQPMYLAFPLLVCAYGLVFVGLPAGVLYLLVRWSKGYNRRHPR